VLSQHFRPEACMFTPGRPRLAVDRYLRFTSQHESCVLFARLAGVRTRRIINQPTSQLAPLCCIDAVSMACAEFYREPKEEPLYSMDTSFTVTVCTQSSNGTPRQGRQDDDRRPSGQAWTLCLCLWRCFSPEFSVLTAVKVRAPCCLRRAHRFHLCLIQVVQPSFVISRWTPAP
jgi:hypothetical protein